MFNHQERQVHQEERTSPPSAEIDKIAREIVDACFSVHKDLGSGLIENAYGTFLLDEFIERGIAVKTQFPLGVKRKNKVIDMAYRLDFLVEDKSLLNSNLSRNCCRCTKRPVKFW